MGKKNRKAKKSTVTPSAPVQATPSAGAEMGRRILLGMVAILLVARSLVTGEDPGLLSEASNTSNLVLSFLWLLTGTGWALWLYITRASLRGGGWSDLAHIALVVVIFISAGHAGYKQPAWLIAWEWLIFLLALFLMQQLVRTASDRRYTIALLLANIVSLSCFAVFQQTVTRPNAIAVLDEEEKRVEQARKILAQRERIVGAVGGAPALPVVFLMTGNQEGELEHTAQLLREKRRVYIEQNHARATFDFPSSFAGYLGLLLPALFLSGLTIWQINRRNYRVWIIGGAALICLAALWLTHSRGALLALFVVGGLGTAWRYRANLRDHLKLTIAAAVLIVTGVAGAILFQSQQSADPRGSIPARLDFWSASWNMIRDQPGLGVGPGNFSRHYLQYKTVEAPSHVSEPHNFLLEIWATSGIFALIFLVASLGLFFWKIREAAALPRDPEPTQTEGKPGPRWEFYIGGMVGLLLGFILREMASSPEEALHPNLATEKLIMVMAGLACARSVIWFAAFALFEQVVWSPRRLAMAIWAGVGVLTAALLVSGGISFPSIAQPLWVMVGLGMGLIVKDRPAREGSVLRTVAPLPILGGLALAYLTYLLIPVSKSNAMAVQAMRAASFYQQHQQDRFRSQLQRVDFLYTQVAQPLSEATVEQDAIGCSSRRLQLSRVFREIWLMSLSADIPTEKVAHYWRSAWLNADGAIHLDVRNIEALRQRAEMHMLTAVWATESPQARKSLIRKAVELLEAAVAFDPTRPHNHYRLAEGYIALGKARQAADSIRKALQLDRTAPPGNRLTRKEKARMNRWLPQSAQIP